ncbi:hypothetical protein [Chlamydia vaughanii]|uniref:hypothetical protein n=1 Tax=Chlamydia vaughanii TaxID=3112552 RepID=UPI0032B16101
MSVNLIAGGENRTSLCTAVQVSSPEEKTIKSQRAVFAVHIIACLMLLGALSAALVCFMLPLGFEILMAVVIAAMVVTVILVGLGLCQLSIAKKQFKAYSELNVAKLRTETDLELLKAQHAKCIKREEAEQKQIDKLHREAMDVSCSLS